MKRSRFTEDQIIGVLNKLVVYKTSDKWDVATLKEALGKF